MYEFSRRWPSVRVVGLSAAVPAVGRGFIGVVQRRCRRVAGPAPGSRITQPRWRRRESRSRLAHGCAGSQAPAVGIWRTARFCVLRPGRWPFVSGSLRSAAVRTGSHNGWIDGFR